MNIGRYVGTIICRRQKIKAVIMRQRVETIQLITLPIGKCLKISQSAQNIKYSQCINGLEMFLKCLNIARSR